MFHYPNNLRNRRANKLGNDRRNGAAVVELAIVLPVLLILVFGTLEICQRLYVKQSTVIACYEACRVATRQNNDTAAVQTSLESLLTQYGITWKNIQIRDLTNAQNNLDAIETGDEIRVRVTVEWAPNVITRHVIADQGEFITKAHMLRE